MGVDPLVPRAAKLVLVLEAIDDDKVRINSASLDNPLVVLANEALEWCDREASAGRRGTPSI
jgi:hypothetical protein